MWNGSSNTGAMIHLSRPLGGRKRGILLNVSLDTVTLGKRRRIVSGGTKRGSLIGADADGSHKLFQIIHTGGNVMKKGRNRLMTQKSKMPIVKLKKILSVQTYKREGKGVIHVNIGHFTLIRMIEEIG